MELGDLKSRLQNHLTDGLATVVGSGLSCAEGLPSMLQLGEHLENTLAHSLTKHDETLWHKIASDLKTLGLEGALLKTAPSATLEAAIVAETTAFIGAIESEVLSEAITGKRQLRFTRLLKHLLKPKGGIEIITTNYDRLIELACEQANLGVNTMFLGNYCATVNEAGARMSFCSEMVVHNKRPRLMYREHANIYKPHGSLDWYQRDDQPIRYSGTLPLPRLVITPGLNKFRTGYNRPFDVHREKANSAIQNASRFLIIGYGFNDDHLETHLTPRIKTGAPTVILSKGLSSNAQSICSGRTNVLAICEDNVAGVAGTRVRAAAEEGFFPGIHLWDLKNFIQEVLE